MQRSILFASAALAFAPETDAGSTAPPTDKPQAAQPVPEAATIAAINAADATKRDASKRKQATARATGKPATAKPKPGAKPAVAKAAKPAKPVDAKQAAKREAARTANAEAHDKLRAVAARFYAGPSNAAHKHKPAKLADYISRVRKPVQAPAGGNASVRDESGLGLILSGCDKSGRFDPCKLSIDLGVLSRLSALGFVTVGSGDSPAFSLTKPGLERARVVAKRAQAA